jgi:hypothetical protein
VENIKKAFLPLGVFMGVVLFHYLWFVLFPEKNPVQSEWVAVDNAGGSAWSKYLESQSYFMSYAYALSLAFAAVAFRKYRKEKARHSKNLAIGGVTLSGFLAVAGCFLLGCCGSPMLGVYLSLFGASFLPFAKPLIAGITTLIVAGSWWWMNRKINGASKEQDCGCDEACTPVKNNQ